MTLSCLRGVLVALTVSLLLAACAVPVQQSVRLPADYFSAGKGKVGVVMGDLPKPDTAFPGASCLLCVMVASGMHTALGKEVAGFSTDELKPLPADLVGLLKNQGLDVVLISEPLKIAELPNLGGTEPRNKSRKDFSALRTKHNIDRLLVVNITSLGVWRSYSAYVPTDIPRAVVNGNASLVNLADHSLEWYVPIAVSRAADGNWDEPPKYPGLANAYYQVLESTLDMIKRPFAR